MSERRQVYFRISHDEDQAMWRAFRDGRATEYLNLIVTTHVAREHHAGQAERADAWDEAHEDFCVVAGQMQCTLHENPYRIKESA